MSRATPSEVQFSAHWSQDSSRERQRATKLSPYFLDFYPYCPNTFGGLCGGKGEQEEVGKLHIELQVKIRCLKV